MAEGSTPDGLFAADSVIRRVNGESALLLGGGRALLLQLAHPAVAAGVAEHSDFEADPLRRLTGTLNAMATIVYGTVAQAEAVGAALNRVHAGVIGQGYRANDPALKLWVHATLVDTALRIHRRFLTPLPPPVAATFYEESTVLAAFMGIPRADQPADLTAFKAYVRAMVGSLVVSDQARTVARAVLHPRVPLVAHPVVELGRQLSAGLLPGPIRRQYGFGWDPGREALLQAAGLTSRLTLARMPAVLRRPPGIGLAHRVA